MYIKIFRSSDDSMTGYVSSNKITLASVILTERSVL